MRGASRAPDRSDRWQCSVCGIRCPYGPDHGRTCEQARRTIRSACYHDRDHHAELQLIDATQRRYDTRIARVGQPLGPYGQYRRTAA